jgi:CRISPR/Cas system-associated protein endoribonuclease Cas2
MEDILLQMKINTDNGNSICKKFNYFLLKNGLVLYEFPVFAE